MGQGDLSFSYSDEIMRFKQNYIEKKTCLPRNLFFQPNQSHQQNYISYLNEN